MSEPARHPAPVPVEVWTVIDAYDTYDSGELSERRAHERNQTESCRPIALQLIDQAGAALSDWHQADILDVSFGGLCLLLMEDVPLELSKLMRLRLDVRPHPGFGVDALMAELRWFVRSGMIVSLGVGFADPLHELPELLACRRSQRRPLNLDQSLA